MNDQKAQQLSAKCFLKVKDEETFQKLQHDQDFKEYFVKILNVSMLKDEYRLYEIKLNDRLPHTSLMKKILEPYGVSLSEAEGQEWFGNIRAEEESKNVIEKKDDHQVSSNSSFLISKPRNQQHVENNPIQNDDLFFGGNLYNSFEISNKSCVDLLKMTDIHIFHENSGGIKETEGFPLKQNSLSLEIDAENRNPNWDLSTIGKFSHLQHYNEFRSIKYMCRRA